MTANQYGVRTGDRYVWLMCHITVSRAGTNGADVRVLKTDTGVEWEKHQSLPFPSDWIKVHSEPPEKCERCDFRPPAPGMAHCDECIDMLAEWGG